MSTKSPNVHPPTSTAQSRGGGARNERHLFQCEICTNDYDNQLRRPFVLLPCGHTVCSVCIDQLENKQCPSDRRAFTDKVLNWEVHKCLAPSLELTPLIASTIQASLRLCELQLAESYSFCNKRCQEINAKFESLFTLINQKRFKLNVQFVKNKFLDELNVYAAYSGHFKRTVDRMKSECTQMNNEFNSNIEREANLFAQNFELVKLNFSCFDRILDKLLAQIEDASDNQAFLDEIRRDLTQLRPLDFVDAYKVSRLESEFERQALITRHESRPIDDRSNFIITNKAALILIVLACLTLAFSLSMITTGSYYFDQCPIASSLPQWLILQGLAGFPVVFSAYVLFFYCKLNQNHTSKLTLALLISPLVLCSLVAVGIFLYGNFLLFSISDRVNLVDRFSSNFCQERLYLFAAACNILPYAILGLASFGFLVYKLAVFFGTS